ncbi:MAG: transporter substrate-binding domain-containing protein [Pseudomonadaceae bacterium]
MSRALLLPLLLLLTVTSHAETIRLNTDIFPPYQVREGDRLTGSSVKALACIFDAMQVDYEIRVLPWERAVQDVADGKAEGFFSATRMNRARSFATLSAPLALEKWYWFSNSDSRPANNGQGSGLHIAGIRGSNEVEWLTQHNYRVDPLVSGTGQLLQLLQRGRIDAFLADQQTLRIELTRQPTVLRPRFAHFLQYTTLGVYFSNRYLGANPAFLEQFNANVFSCLPEYGVLRADERQRLHQIHDQLFDHWRTQPELIAAVKAQNTQHKSLSIQQIHQLDQQWLGEQRLPSEQRELTNRVLHTPLADWLREQQTQLDGMISELIITDQQGLNVAISEPTTDYWQGDETKFTEPFFSEQPYMSTLTYDQSTRRFQVHVSTPIRDPQTDTTIGVLIIGLDIERALSMDDSPSLLRAESP